MTDTNQTTDPLVEMRDIHISFGGVKAVDGVSIDLYPGEVVGVLGRIQHGAGHPLSPQTNHNLYIPEALERTFCGFCSSGT